jgi:hypothetical protein
MGFTNNEDSDGDGRMPPLTATIVDVGVDYRDYGDDKDESRLIIFWKPDNDVFGIQTEILSNSTVLNVTPAPRVIRVGGSERGFDLEVIGHVIKSGKLGYKAAVVMAKLKALGVKTPEDTGDLRELIGVKAVIKQLTYNEAKGRPKKDSEKVFWVPVEIISGPESQVPTEEEVTQQEKKEPVEDVITPSLKEDILANAEGLNEGKLVEWFEKSVHYDGTTVVPLFVALTEILGAGSIAEKDGVYVVGIKESIAAAEGHSDDLGQIEEEVAPSPSSKPGGQ